MTQMNLTEGQLAERLGVSVRTLQRWRWQKTGPRYYKLSPGRGGRVRYRLADVERYEAERLAAQERGAAA
ncbi:helix-turn-helix domain-containing protein [Streptomyces sp. S1A]|uniref:helix-turn-helix transcriptional regulator n=1 Tax=Streptomyces sp. ICN903 TaxID=2964654 RepID=UPI001EDAEF8A|nr:helix-turn-helix domain-containing protein [Streptomyces sp. ICN903]MCG3039176.1 helix-turn-helix domain-containing protein [Streptomyces sp. ICN903]